MLALLLLVSAGPAEAVREAALHHLVGDDGMAVEVLSDAVTTFPDSQEVACAYVKGLAAQGAEPQAIGAYGALIGRFGQECDREGEVLESVAWAVIQNGARSGAPTHRLISTIAAAVTQDGRAVELLLQRLRSSHAIERALAVELSALLRDAALKGELKRLLAQESVRAVRLSAIQAAGVLHMQEMRPQLEAIVASSHTSAEEKLAAIKAIVAMLDDIGLDELRALAEHPRAGLRELACEAVGILEVDAPDLLLERLEDSHPYVRRAALMSLGWSGSDATVLSAVTPLLHDPDPEVAISASWLVTLVDPEQGRPYLETWLNAERVELARLAASAVAASGKHGVPLAKMMVRDHPDPFVRANLAIGLIGQREEVERAAQTLHEVLKGQRGRWMWDESYGAAFRVLCPSRIRHEATTPNQPELVDQLTRLEVLGALAVVRYPHTQEAVRAFLSERRWGVAGAAAITLLEEGDEAALAIVRELLDDPNQNIRVQAALGIAIWGHDPTAAGVLEKAYSEGDRELKLRILEALGKIASRESLPFLIERLQEPSQTLRLVAACAILQCLNS